MAIDRTPAEATAKGMFIQKVMDIGKRAAPTREDKIYFGVERRRWVPFLAYSLREQMQLMANVVPLRFPSVSLGEGFRRLGWLAFPTFGESMAARVLLGTAGKTLENVLGFVPQGVMLTVSHAKVEPKRVGDRHWRFTYEDTFCFLGTYHVGILEGIVRAHHETPNVTVNMTTPSSGTFDLRW